MAKLFTEEELEELRRADEELDVEFRLTPEDLRFSRQLDREAAFFFASRFLRRYSR